MSVGRVEIVEDKKEYVRYATMGVGQDGSSESVYIEKFITTETLINNWNLSKGGYVNMCAHMYDSVTNEYLGKVWSDEARYTIKYVPLSFSVIPYAQILSDIYPISACVFGSDFFSCLGIGVDLTQGMFKFTNQKAISENPFLTWFNAYPRNGDSGTVSQLKESYPMMLFRGFLKKLETDNPMYLTTESKTKNDAESTLY